MLTGQCKNSRLAHRTVYEEGGGGKLRRPALQKLQTCSQDGVYSQNGVCSQDVAKGPDLLTGRCVRKEVRCIAHRTVHHCAQDGV